ncbi:MAG: LysR substrate-binding domain-containing protein, partial [Gaiellales bacterium]
RALAGLEGGTIRLGASSTPGVYVLPDALGVFRDDHPDVTVEVEIASTGEILDRLLTGRLELALVGQTRADGRIHLEPFLEDEVVGITAPGTLSIVDGQVSPQALEEQTLLVRERGSATRNVAEQALAHVGSSASKTWELDSTEAIKRATRAGLGYSFVSRYAALEEIDRGDLVAFRLDRGPRMVRSLYVARLGRRPLTPSEKSFLATLTSCSARTAELAQTCLA